MFLLSFRAHVTEEDFNALGSQDAETFYNLYLADISLLQKSSTFCQRFNADE